MKIWIDADERYEVYSVLETPRLPDDPSVEVAPEDLARWAAAEQAWYAVQDEMKARYDAAWASTRSGRELSEREARLAACTFRLGQDTGHPIGCPVHDPAATTVVGTTGEPTTDLRVGIYDPGDTPKDEPAP